MDKLCYDLKQLTPGTIFRLPSCGDWIQDEMEFVSWTGEDMTFIPRKPVHRTHWQIGVKRTGTFYREDLEKSGFVILNKKSVTFKRVSRRANDARRIT